MLIVLQYWRGDEQQALSLARFLADIEPHRRDDVILILARAWNCPLSAEATKVREHCAKKMRTILLQSGVERSGHPDGCYGLWAGTVGRLYQLHRDGVLPWDFATVATFEADGWPVRRDWIARLKASHARTLERGLRITGAVMDEPMPHVNGNMVMELSVWGDFPSLHTCTPQVAWDVLHAQVLMPLARPCNVIRNEYGTRDWTAGCLSAVAREAAWVHGVKDDSVAEIVRGWARDWT